MKHRIGFLLFILLAFSCARPSIPVGTDTGYIVDNFGDNVLTGFHFDQNGYVWMMPSAGRYLFKTDGSIYIRYEYDPDVPSSLSANKVNDLTVDGQNRVWVATQKGVDRFDPARGCFDHIPVDDSNNYVIDIDQDGKGRIVIVTRRALLELDEESGRFVRKFQIPHLTLSEPHLSFDGSGNLWLRLDNSLTCFDENYNQLFKKEYARLAGTPVYDGSKYIWVSDGDKLMTLNIHSFKEAEANDLFPGLAGIRPANLLKVSDGLLVVNSATGPFLVDLSRDTATDLQHAEGKEKTILEYAQAGSRALQTGPNGNLWIADREGGFQHHIFNLGWVPLDRKYLDFLVSGDVQTSAQNRHFTWLVSGGRIAAYDKENGQFTSIQDIRSLTDLIVSMVSADEEGHVLLSGRARAARPLELFTTEPDGSLVFEKRFKLPYAGIGTITRDGSIYAVGTGTVIMRVEKDGTIREIANLFNDYACYATLMKPLSDGSILICFTDHAPVLFHPEDERVEVLETAGLDQVYFSAIEEDALSSVWIGSTDKGLYRYDKADGSFGKVADYPETTVNSIAADENGNVFVIGDYHAVYRFGTATGEDGRPVWADYADFPKERRLYPLPDGTVALVGQGTYEWFNEERVNTPQDVEIFTHIYLTSGKRILYSFPAAAYPSNRVTLHLDRNTEDLNLFIGVMDMTSPYSHHSYFYDINHFRTGPRESFDKPQIPLYGVSRPYNTIRFRVAGNSESSSTEPFTIRVLMNLLPGEIISLVAVLSLLAAAAVFWFLSRKKKEEAEAERIKREMTE